jgi:hypothetical protein
LDHIFSKMYFIKGSVYNTDMLCSGSNNDLINFYKINEDDKNKIEKLFSVPSVKNK